MTANASWGGHAGLTSNTEAPVIKDVRNPDQCCQSSHGSGREKYLITGKFQLYLIYERAIELLRPRSEYGLMCISTCKGSIFVVQSRERFHGNMAFASIEFRYVL